MCYRVGYKSRTKELSVIMNRFVCASSAVKPSVGKPVFSRPCFLRLDFPQSVENPGIGVTTSSRPRKLHESAIWSLAGRAILKIAHEEDMPK